MIDQLIKLQNAISRSWQQHWNVWRLRSMRPRVTCQGNPAEYRLIGSLYLRVKQGGRLVLGRKLTVSSGVCWNPIARNIRTAMMVEPEATLTIGDNVGISSACLWAHQQITIGNNVKIGADSVLIDSDCHSLDCVVRRTDKDPQHKACAPIRIEDDVLIGARCIILKGVIIGARAVVGAGSVVTKSIPADETWAGNPAKCIR